MKRVLFLFVSLLLLVSFVSAIEVNIKESYQPFETIIIKLSGVFLDAVTEDKIHFYRNGHVELPMNQKVANIDGDYYIYALLPGDERDYTFRVEDVEYMKAREVSDSTIERNFSVAGEVADFTIDPGFLIVNKNFGVNLINNKDSSITVGLEFNSASQDYSLKTGEIQKVVIDISDVESPDTLILKASSGSVSYDVPVQVIENKTMQDEKDKELLHISIENFDEEILLGEVRIFTIYLRNLGDDKIENVKFDYNESFDGVMTIDPLTFDEIRGKSIEKLKLTFFSEDESEYSGIFYVKSDNATTNMTLDVKFVEQYYWQEDDNESSNGNSGDNGTPNTPSVNLSEGPKESNTGKIIGWGLLVVVVLFLVWFFLF